MPKDLEFIRSVVKTWPDENSTHVRLDRDGEVCFWGATTKHDFFPGGGEVHFVSADSILGHRYTRKQWAGEE